MDVAGEFQIGVDEDAKIFNKVRWWNRGILSGAYLK